MALSAERLIVVRRAGQRIQGVDAHARCHTGLTTGARVPPNKPFHLTPDLAPFGRSDRRR